MHSPVPQTKHNIYRVLHHVDVEALGLVPAVGRKALIQAPIEALDQGVAVRVDRGASAQLQQRDNRQEGAVLKNHPVSVNNRVSELAAGVLKLRFHPPHHPSPNFCA